MKKLDELQGRLTNFVARFERVLGEGDPAEAIDPRVRSESLLASPDLRASYLSLVEIMRELGIRHTWNRESSVGAEKTPPPGAD